MRYKPKDSITIKQVQNGFYVEFNGDREMQQDNIGAVKVFNDIDEMLDNIRTHFKIEGVKDGNTNSNTDTR